MKSKYYLALVLVGILPVLAITGVYFWMLFNQVPAPKAPVVDTAAVQAAIPLLKTQVDTMANSMASAIERLNGDIPNIFAHNSDADLDTFVKTHQGVTGVVVLSAAGKVEKTIPSSPPLITDPSYGTSEEFQKTAAKLKENGGKPYLFFTLKLGYPAFIFATGLSNQSIGEAVVNLANFFRGIDANSGEIFLLEAGSGNYFYHTNPAKWGTAFNTNQEAWLAGLQKDLSEKKGGYIFNPDKISAVYAPVFGKFGIVHMFPSSILQPPSPAPAANPRPSLENLPQLILTPMSLAILISLGWICIVGVVFFGAILSPLRKASAAILNAANGSGGLSTEVVHQFGKDEIGQMVQAVSNLMERMEGEKKQTQQEKEEALRRARAEIDSKTKDAANQVAEAQKQAQASRTELNDKNQLLNDKLKELDALKGMSEGLRNQTEQAKAEIGKLKGQVADAEQGKSDAEKNLTQSKNQLEAQFKEMEAKLLQAVGASSAIKVSQVRAAAIRTMSEELKTTLGIIKGYVSSALGTTQGGINEKQQEFLGMVINRSARLEKFINDLVDIYQVEIEQQEAKYEEVNLASEIEGLAFNFQAQADVKNIKMKVEANPTVPKVPIVRRRFNQLWNILYLQLIKDAPRGSNLPISVESVGDLVKVTLHDPGMTVLPESLPKLFDEFYDPKHPASPQLAGTGLKFALVKTILAAHGGGAVAEKDEPGTKMILTFSTKIKKPGDAPKVPGVMAPSPSMTAPGLKPGVTPTLGTPAGLPKPAVPGITVPGLPKPAAPGAPPPPPVPGMAKPVPPPPPGMPSAPTAPKPAAPAGAGMLDALLAGKVPPAAPGLKPPAPAPAAPSVGMPAPPMGAPAAPKPPIPIPGMPAAPAPAMPKPATPAAPGLLDALLEKKPAAPGIPPAAPAMGAPPAAPKPPMPTAAPPIMPAAPKPAMPPMGAPGMMAPPVARPPMPGVPPAMAPAPSVIPTALKPAPVSGVLNLDSSDGPKLDAGAPKPPVPPPGMKPPMPGAPPMGAPKPPSPGVPPGGLNTTTPPPKKDDGELIE